MSIANNHLPLYAGNWERLAEDESCYVACVVRPCVCLCRSNSHATRTSMKKNDDDEETICSKNWRTYLSTIAMDFLFAALPMLFSFAVLSRWKFISASLLSLLLFSSTTKVRICYQYWLSYGLDAYLLSEKKGRGMDILGKNKEYLAYLARMMLEDLRVRTWLVSGWATVFPLEIIFLLREATSGQGSESCFFLLHFVQPRSCHIGFGTKSSVMKLNLHALFKDVAFVVIHLFVFWGPINCSANGVSSRKPPSWHNVLAVLMLPDYIAGSKFSALGRSIQPEFTRCISSGQWRTRGTRLKQYDLSLLFEKEKG